MGKPATVDQYIAALEPWKAKIVEAARRIILSAVPDASESVKWAQPVYELNGPFCAVKAHAKHVTVVFWRGQELTKICSRIEGSGTKMGHLKFFAYDEIDRQELSRICREAARLNSVRGNPNLPGQKSQQGRHSRPTSRATRVVK